MKRVPSLLLVLLLAAPAAAEIDFSAVAARADAQAAVTTGKTYAAYAQVQRALAKPDVPGLGDDFKKLRAAAGAADGRLAGDAVFVEAVGAALAQGQSALDAQSTQLVQLAASLESDRDRGRCGTASAKGRRLAARSQAARDDGRERKCADLGRRASRAYAEGIALATKLLARQDARKPTWSVPLQGLGGALLSVWCEPGSAPEVYAVGADDGSGPLFLKKGGEGWVRIPVLPRENLWWVTRVGAAIYASGTGGLVVRYDPATGSLTEMPVPVDATFFGIWGAAEDDIWAVGGNVGGMQPRTALYHWNGQQWDSVPQPPQAGARILFKIWGSAADDVSICGEQGLVLHYDGQDWGVVPSGTTATLFTIHGADPTIAVGDAIIERGAQGFAMAQIPAGSNPLRGVFVPEQGDAWACGLAGTVLRRVSGRWQRLLDVPSPGGARDFHAVAVDDGGGVYLAGGDLIDNDEGVLYYFGPRTIPSAVVPQAKLRGNVATVLYDSCAVTACHIGPFISEDLDLSTPEAARAQQVGVASRQSPLLRVVPGRPSQSYTWHKILGTHLAAGGTGDRMPQGGPFLDDPAMEKIRAWILEGALDN